MGVTAFLHVKLDVADLERARRFYCDLLSLRPIVRYDRDDGVTILQLSPTGEPPGVELWYEPPFRPDPGDRLHIAFAVTDLPAVVARIRDSGWPIEREPFRIGHEQIAFVRDPDGYLIELNEADAAPA
ncbi:MAG TPA: VOC family protein [Longimicrobium sp.]|nr:VOC family protein [Longimicrobium sp.]